MAKSKSLENGTESNGGWFDWLGKLHPSVWQSTAIALVSLVILYYGLGALWVNETDADINFSPRKGRLPEKTSYTINMTQGLVDRMVNENHWTANGPPFMPGYLLDNMPNFQLGIMAAAARYIIEVSDHVARAHGSGKSDPDLKKAVGLLNYPGDVWVFDFSTSVAPRLEPKRSTGLG